MQPVVDIQYLGLQSYPLIRQYQEELLQEIIEIKIKNRKGKTNIPTPNYFLYVSHPHVYTLGKSGDKNHLLIHAAERSKLNISFYNTNRGGDITYHGPGQIIGYPILDLDNFFTDIHKYLRYLEETVIRTLADFEIEANRIPGKTGVWIDAETVFARKICAMGIRASRWVTMHGFALNVNTDLSYFDHIIPCGIKDRSVTSMQKELEVSEVSEEEVKKRLLFHFSSIFDSKMRVTSAYKFSEFKFGKHILK